MTATTASNPELEAAILEAPDNVDAYLVYGDWLQAQGDPRGELMALQHTLPSARFIRGLTIGMVSFDGDNAYASVVDQMAEAGGSKTLQDLFIGDFEYPGETELSSSRLSDISKALKVFPNLRTLRLRGFALELSAIDLPELREFTVESGRLPLEAVRSIAHAKWPKLERLEIWFGSDNYGAGGGVEDLQPILDGEGLPNLKRLGLRNSEFTDDLCAALPAAKVLPRLEKLDLSMGIMSDEGARALAGHAAAFAHLAQLDVTDNMLTNEGQTLLSKALPNVSAGNQREYDEDYRYASVTE